MTLSAVEINSSGSFSFLLEIRLLLATVRPSIDHFNFLSYIEINGFVNDFLNSLSLLKPLSPDSDVLGDFLGEPRFLGKLRISATLPLTYEGI